jgi:hypothetical protein
MPNGWTIVGTPDDLIDLLNDPHAFAEEVERRVAAAGAVVGHILWEDDPRRAHVLTHVPSRTADETFERLGDSLGPTRRLYNEIEEMVRRG